MCTLKPVDVASSFGENSDRVDNGELREISHLLWGPAINSDVFNRWSQGLEFSPYEPSALVQYEGGPCAVIAPVQAYLLKILLAETFEHCLHTLTADKCNRLLIQAVCSILHKCSRRKYKIAELSNSRHKPGTRSSRSHDKDGIDTDVDRKPNLTPSAFHERVNFLTFDDIADVDEYYTKNVRVLCKKYGLLLFLYSVVNTKDVRLAKAELSDASEPLIHETYGNGSQGLINLMLTGRAVAHVWDHEQVIGGLKLKGIDRQSDIGFITLMEQMQYCTVGSFYKNPRHPVWIMASETHLTVLFSFERRLVSPETPHERARRTFKQYDPEGNNFIQSRHLHHVLRALDLVSDPEYVDIMQKKLDADKVGIILLNAFMEEFFDDEKRSTPDTFRLHHYNGIPRSNLDNNVTYIGGDAVLLECDIRSVCQSNSVLACLQTKWPSIDVNWIGPKEPSLN